MKAHMLVGSFLVLAALVAACAPTERYYTNKIPEPPRPRATNGPGTCSIATPVTRLQSRASNQRSVEGFGSLPCPTPTTPGKR